MLSWSVDDAQMPSNGPQRDQKMMSFCSMPLAEVQALVGSTVHLADSASIEENSCHMASQSDRNCIQSAVVWFRCADLQPVTDNGIEKLPLREDETLELAVMGGKAALSIWSANAVQRQD